MLHTHRDGRLVSRRSEPYSWHKVRTASLHTSSRECRPAPSRRPKGAPRRASSAERVAQHTRHTAFEWRLTNVFFFSAHPSRRVDSSFSGFQFFSCLACRVNRFPFAHARAGASQRAPTQRLRSVHTTHCVHCVAMAFPCACDGLALLHLPPPSPPPVPKLLCGRHRTHCLALQESTPAPPDPHPLALAHASCCRC